MNTEEKEALSLKGDMSRKAAAIRIHAARIYTGMGQEQLAQSMGEGMTKQKVGNAERGDNFPSPTLMRYFYRNHRIDFTFLMHGDYAQLPGDVQERIFDALVNAHSEWDRKASSGRPQGAPQSIQQQTPS